MADITYDSLTGLPSITSFYDQANKLLSGSRDYYLVYFDITRFKYINDILGTQAADQILSQIGELLLELCGDSDCAARVSSDKFVILKSDKTGRDLFIIKLISRMRYFDLPFELMCNYGIYMFTDEPVELAIAVENAALAQARIKGSYTDRSLVYEESFRQEYVSEGEIIGMFEEAIKEHQFQLYFQAQYDHSTGLIVGAEGLVRWIHPSKGVVSPAVFIPILEKTGLITVLDLYVFEQACDTVKYCIDNKIHLVPVSTNFSRHDLRLPDFVEKLEDIRKRYTVDSKYLRVEVTESVVADSLENTNRIVDQLHDCGYLVEMDDFGSGYSSLNVLKDVNFDVIKLDMRFMTNEAKNRRGGMILTAIVNMAQWLNIPVIAEGVETIEQADFLLSIGSEYIQGYLYAKPIPRIDFIQLLKGSSICNVTANMSFLEKIDTCDFWDPNSQDTLIFSNFVGPAAIFYYRNDGEIVVSRVNEKYIEELYMNNSQKDIVSSRFLDSLDEKNSQIYHETVMKAIESQKEETCETWRVLKSECCGETVACIRTNIRMIARGSDKVLFYAMIRNITAEKREIATYKEYERNFKYVVEHANVYFWEYTIATKEMRPCFRCMRDLGLPPLIKNYPEPLIESGLFPADYADFYRDLMRRVDSGEEQIEAVIPLTANRIPFRICYTTEFDSVGNPKKAYGSATLIRNEEEQKEHND